MEKIYKTVLLTGSKDSLKLAQAGLIQAGYEVSSATDYELLVSNVFQSDVEDMDRTARSIGCSIEGLYGEAEVDVKKPVHLRKALKLSVEEGKWYFAENAEEVFPLVLVREVAIERTGSDSEDGETIEENQVFTLELLGPDDGLPYQIKMGSKTLAKWGLRPATEDDFFERDIVPPEIGSLTKSAAVEITAAPKEGFDNTLGRLRNRR